MIRLEDWDKLFSNLGMGKLGMHELFRVADLNSDGVVGPDEWDVF